MTGYLAQLALSNLCFSLGLALVAWAVHRHGRLPHVAHLLWLLVLAKLVTPPVVFIPLATVPGMTASGLQAVTEHLGLRPPVTGLVSPGLRDVAAGQSAGGTVAAGDAALLEAIGSGLTLLWGLGSAVILAWSLVRIYRFDRLLRIASQVAPPELQRAASEIARRLRLKSTPVIYTTAAHISPMVWPMIWRNGGRVRVVIPAALIDEMSGAQLRWVLAHELGHVRRRDHLVRWLEWLACILFWWNPVAWWARRNLRINEEICCDALVLASLAPAPRTYANALVTAVECLAAPAIRPPALASGINGGGFLEGRLHMILSKHPIPKSPRWLRALLLCSCVLLPLGATYAEDGGPGIGYGLAGVGAPEAGTWRAGSATAHATTGDIRITESGLAFANGSSLSITPAYPGGRHVFAVDPAADPAMRDGKRLCRSPVTYVALLTYHGFALAVHMYDGTHPPAAPTPANFYEFGRKEKCASYYYLAP